eukprot:TRINITY_DN1173_c0_g1_i1.p1 TRINITY_DN1173_c0_g1~~TRINITY_DN1173_c0_g1_i1.p1  ORF type:complete len:520 (-),score=91.17 TRINITY_DN1173_c0_g1_i1:913-2472(-)
MTYASHIIKSSKKLYNAQNILGHEPAILVRCFSKNGGPSTDLLRPCQHSFVPSKGDGSFRFSVEGIPNKANGFNHGHRMPSCKAFKGYFLSTATKMDISTACLGFNKSSPCCQRSARRGFSTDSGLPSHQEIGMPSLSPTMTEGNIARWLKKEGDKISPGEVLCEVETDKATVEMECMEEGYLVKIIHGDGAKDIKVGEVIAITVEEEDAIEKFKDYKAPASTTADEVKGSPDPTPSTKEVLEPVPLSSVNGTGPEGRIVKADIEDYLASSLKGVPKSAKETSAHTLEYSELPLSQIRKVTASRLLLSKQSIPHYYLTVDACVNKLMDLRSQLNTLQEASGGKRISVNDLVIKAAALALLKVPQCNSSWMKDYIRQYHNVNINIAVQTDNGLFVPVIRDADKKGLSKIAEEVKHLAQKAKDNSLKPEDYEGGTFTVSNLGGPFGIKQFCAIVNPPQAAILAVGSAEKRVIPGDGPNQFEFRSFMPVTLSCDHRVIDGAIGAEYLKAFKGYIENPQSMLI